MTSGKTFSVGRPGLTAASSQGQNLSTVCVTISNYVKSPYRGICIWAFCYRHFCKRRTSRHWAPNAILLDGMQAQLHQYGLPSPPPVHTQREHLHRGPGSDRKGSEILPLQTRRSERVLGLICHGEYASLAFSPKTSSGWDVSSTSSPPSFHHCHLEILKVLLQHVSPM